MILGDSPMSDYLAGTNRGACPGRRVEEPAPAEADSAGFTDRVPIGNLRPLLWRDWCGHLQAAEHDQLAAELDAELAAMTDPLDRPGRGRSPGT